MDDQIVGDPAPQTIVGDPLPTESIPTKSMLDGVGEDWVVTIHNPLTSGFRVQYARTLAQPFQKTEDHRRLEAKLGTPVERDTLSPAVGHVAQFLELRAGEIKNLPGDIAQIAVRKLTTHILLARDKGKRHNMAADPVARFEVEKEIIIKMTDRMTMMDEINQTVEEKTDQEITGLNQPSVADPPPGQGISY